MQHTYVHEVVARDGLQIEAQFVPTERKVELIDALSETGLAKIEVTSFVSPKAVPNLRDAETVMASIKRNPSVKYVALIANLKGAERAIAARADEVNLVVSVSETHNRANVRRSTDASFEGFAEIMRELERTGIAVSGALSTAFGCPFEGEQSSGRVMQFVGRYVGLGVRSVTLADTTGMGHPKQVLDLCAGVRERWPELELALHFHNTRGPSLIRYGAAREHQGTRRRGQPAGALRDARAQSRARGGISVSAANRSDPAAGALDHRAQRLAGPPFHSVDQPLSRLRARLHLLLRASEIGRAS